LYRYLPFRKICDLHGGFKDDMMDANESNIPKYSHVEFLKLSQDNGTIPGEIRYTLKNHQVFDSVRRDTKQSSSSNAKAASTIIWL
jgi:hypothetical protein